MSSPVRERKCSKEKNAGSSSGSKRICIPIEQEEYGRILAEDTAFREYLDMMIERHPELFPSAIQQGYRLHGALPPSKKMPDVRMRRIKMKEKDDTYWAMKYDLADAYEKNKNAKEALDTYAEVYGWNSNFRDVSEKIDQLGAKIAEDVGKKKPGKKDRVSYL